LWRLIQHKVKTGGEICDGKAGYFVADATAELKEDWLASLDCLEALDPLELIGIETSVPATAVP
jgi:hypothetical protein